jgi:flagellar biosynthesis/type III secretory pathway protein FliH
MSSSDRIERLRLIDFSKQKAEARRNAFVPCTSFEHLRQETPAQPTAEESYQRGLAEGEQRGRAAALKELTPALDALRDIAQSLAAVRAERLGAAEQDLLDVATEIARRILHGELQQGGDVVLRMARACIEEARGSEGPLTLRVAAADLEVLRAHIAELQVDLADHQLRIVPDPRVERGGVVLETVGRCYEGRPQRVLAAARGGVGAGGAR